MLSTSTFTSLKLKSNIHKCTSNNMRGPDTHHATSTYMSSHFTQKSAHQYAFDRILRVPEPLSPSSSSSSSPTPIASWSHIANPPPPLPGGTPWSLPNASAESLDCRHTRRIARVRMSRRDISGRQKDKYTQMWMCCKKKHVYKHVDICSHKVKRFWCNGRMALEVNIDLKQEERERERE